MSAPDRTISRDSKVPLRVLFVEDSELDAELVSFELRRGGYEVESRRVDTEKDFLDALSDEQWDLIISDFSMPNFDGLRAFETFRNQELDIPFIFVSGAMGEERAVRAMKAGARDYILKGQLGRLNAAVQRELEQAEIRRRQREAEAAKEREQSRLAVALQATGAGVFEYRVPADDEAYCNDRFAEILGVTLDELPAADDMLPWFLERVHPDDRAAVAESQQSFIDGTTPSYAFDFRVRHSDGGWRDVSCYAEASGRDESGRAIGLVGVMLDRTQEKRLEEQYRQSQKMEAIGQLAGGIAHDFNNLLTVISNFGEFVLEALEPGQEAHEDMQEVLKAAKRAEKLTGQLLAYSRRRPAVSTTLNVNGLVKDLDNMLQRLLGDPVTLRTHLAADLWNTRIDPGGLEQVLMNLTVNSRDAMPDGGKLSIETSNVDIGNDSVSGHKDNILPGEYVAISVTDTGTGMDEETQSRLFEPFFTTKEPGKGTGLGLATCYGIIKQVGGFIWVYSEPGEGTTFRILLPREVGEQEEPADPTQSERMRGTETLLVVEDDETVRTLVVRLLSMLGYTILEAASAEEAIRVVESSPPPIDAVITDVVMPAMRGPELVERLLVTCPGIRTIYMSGFTRDAAELDESTALLQKPFSPKELAQKVREVLDRADN